VAGCSLAFAAAVIAGYGAAWAGTASLSGAQSVPGHATPAAIARQAKTETEEPVENSAVAIHEGNPDGLARPTPEQAAWEDQEVGMFFHFDIPVFTDKAEGDWQSCGHLDPAIYNPAHLNTDQWMKAARAIGAGYTVFVAKHCSGFLSWQSDLYPYGVKQASWRGGKGDIVRDYVNSCKKAGIHPGLYCSVTTNAYVGVSNPGLVNWGRGGDPEKQAEYTRMTERMLTELWGNYGPLFEIWFDGGALAPDQGGPDLIPILKRLQPHAIVFQGPAGSIRWVGNEDGVAPYPCWATVEHRDDSGAGNPDGSMWLPAECDVPVRNHDWFWHPNSEHKLYSVDQLVDMYYRSVGRGCNLILNANIDRDGLVPDADMKVYRAFGAEIRRRFGKSIAETHGVGDIVEIKLPKPTVIDNVITMEQITEGQRVRQYVIEGLVDGAWAQLAAGQSIGHKRIDRFSPVKVSAVRFRNLRSVGEPLIRKLAVYHVGDEKPLVDHDWRPAEIKGGLLRDVVGGETGHVKGVENVEIPRGPVLCFDGKSGVVSLGKVEVGASDFTISAWVCPAGMAAREEEILAKDQSGVSSNQFRLYLGPGNRLGFAMSGGGGGIWPFETNLGAVPVGEWSLVAVSRHGRGFTLSVDGKAQASATSTDIISHYNGLDLRLGSRYPASGDGPDSVFDGMIGEVRLWNRAVS
jgi:alpha-L-fucosidase